MREDGLTEENVYENSSGKREEQRDTEYSAKGGYARMEELLPLAAWLTRKYTSGESTSVSYETAQMLMEAVLYCITEYMDGNNSIKINGESNTENTAALQEAYRRGYETVLFKVQKAKQLYDALVPAFEDYGCRNYSDTIIQGMPSFFLRYDPVYQPQNSVLTLDYPLLLGNPKTKGIERILTYLEGITIEAEFLSRFSRENICALLERIQPEYQSLYLDNICDPVLLQAVGCLVTDRPAAKLELTEQDAKEAAAYFHGSTKEKIGRQLRFYLRLLFPENMTDIPAGGYRYFEQAADTFAARIVSADRLGFLEALFPVNERISR